jgi:hypothetical protein
MRATRRPTLIRSGQATELWWRHWISATTQWMGPLSKSTNVVGRFPVGDGGVEPGEVDHIVDVAEHVVVHPRVVSSWNQRWSARRPGGWRVLIAGIGAGLGRLAGLSDRSNRPCRTPDLGGMGEAPIDESSVFQVDSRENVLLTPIILGVLPLRLVSTLG